MEKEFNFARNKKVTKNGKENMNQPSKQVLNENIKLFFNVKYIN